MQLMVSYSCKVKVGLFWGVFDYHIILICSMIMPLIIKTMRYGLVCLKVGCLYNELICDLFNNNAYEVGRSYICFLEIVDSIIVALIL